MRTQKITCPSGLAGTVRAWKLKEAEMLAAEHQQKEGEAFDRMLANCWLETSDQGPYSIVKAPKWDEVLLCDRFWILLNIRAVTWGADYPFDVPCKNKRCREPIPWECDVLGLPFKPLPKASFEKIQSGHNSFEAYVDGRLVLFRLQTSAGEKAAEPIRKGYPDNPLAVAVASRIISIDGLGKDEIVDYVVELDIPDVLDLIDDMDEHDGGVETKIEIRCPACRFVQETDLPLEEAFFMPPRDQRRKKRKQLAKESAAESSPS